MIEEEVDQKKSWMAISIERTSMKVVQLVKKRLDTERHGRLC